MTYVPVSQSKSEGVELNGEVINATIVNNNHVVSEQAVVQDNGLKNWKHSLFDLFGDCGKCLKCPLYIGYIFKVFKCFSPERSGIVALPR